MRLLAAALTAAGAAAMVLGGGGGGTFVGGGGAGSGSTYNGPPTRRTPHRLGPGGTQQHRLGPGGTQWPIVGPGGTQQHRLGPGGTQWPILGPGGTRWRPTRRPTRKPARPGSGGGGLPPDYLSIPGWKQCTRSQSKGSYREVCLPAHSGCNWVTYKRLQRSSIPRCRPRPRPYPPRPRPYPPRPYPPRPVPVPAPYVGPGGVPPKYLKYTGWEHCTTSQPANPNEHDTNDPNQQEVICMPQAVIPSTCDPKVYYNLMFHTDLKFCRPDCHYQCPKCPLG